MFLKCSLLWKVYNRTDKSIDVRIFPELDDSTTPTRKWSYFNGQGRTWPVLSQCKSLKIRRSRDFLFRNVIRQFLTLKSCEKVGQQSTRRYLKKYLKSKCSRRELQKEVSLFWTAYSSQRNIYIYIYIVTHCSKVFLTDSHYGFGKSVKPYFSDPRKPAASIFTTDLFTLACTQAYLVFWQEGENGKLFFCSVCRRKINQEVWTLKKDLILKLSIHLSGLSERLLH